MTQFSVAVITMVLGTAPGVGAVGQTSVRGEVVDRESGAYVENALVRLSGIDRQVFTDGRGRFRFDNVTYGDHTIAVRQIGFAPRDVSITLGSTGSSEIQVELSRVALVLPELSVRARAEPCSQPGALDSSASQVLEAALSNLERVRILEEQYPMRYRRAEMTARLDARRKATIVRQDTVEELSSARVQYHAGSVLRQGKVTDPFTLFSASDIAGEEFRTKHCFWLDADSTERGETIALRFQPITSVGSADWSGVLALDARSSLLLSAELSLANIPPGSSTKSAKCETTYRMIAPSVVHEQLLVCETTNRGSRSLTVLDARELLGFEFTSSRPWP